MLLQIRDFIRQGGVVSTQQLTREFAVDLSALQPMLQVWERKGIIQKCNELSACQSTCFKCKNQAPDYYCFTQSLGTK